MLFPRAGQSFEPAKKAPSPQSRTEAKGPLQSLRLSGLVYVYQFVLGIAHAKFRHGTQLTQAVAALDAFHKVMVDRFGHAENHIAAGLIHQQA